MGCPGLEKRSAFPKTEPRVFSIAVHSYLMDELQYQTQPISKTGAVPGNKRNMEDSLFGQIHKPIFCPKNVPGDCHHLSLSHINYSESVAS